ncbi:MAG: CBS domain-containing protein [Nitrospirae bacterium]|nr:CBS domain-containing protein [Nitrospirota bacterium]MCL5284506.1 CBS domain-containing protein [Nitrospirota bacterium]
MTSDVKTCTPDSTLASVANVMWSENVGSVPVVDSGGKPVGIVTDRDIAMSSFLNHRSLWELQVQEVVHGQTLWTCRPEDPVETAIEIMKAHEIRRLPVVDKAGHLVGLLSLGDLASAAEPGAGRMKPPLPLNSLDPVFKAVFSHHAMATG